MLHCKPLVPVVQFDDVAVSETSVAVPPFTEIVADWVLDETYCGLTAVDADDAGIAIVNFAVPCFGVIGTAGAEPGDEPPPPHAVKSIAAAKTKAEPRKTFTQPPERRMWCNDFGLPPPARL